MATTTTPNGNSPDLSDKGTALLKKLQERIAAAPRAQLRKFHPGINGGLFAALPGAADDDVDTFRMCVNEFLRKRMSEVIAEDGKTISANEAWVVRFLLEASQALDDSAMTHTQPSAGFRQIEPARAIV